MRKRIALFVGEMYMDYQSKLYLGIEKVAKERDVYVDVISNYGIYAVNYLHTLGELNVINIPDISKYDGILLMLDTLTIEGMQENTLRLIRENAKCPIVCIRAGREEYYNLLIDDKASQEEIVEYFFEHGYTKIDYMTGIDSMEDSQRRFQGYLDVMERHNVTVTENMVYHGNYWNTKGVQAVDCFLKDGDIPEAIVCANDYMAISVINELKNRGFNVPSDIKVTGFDDIEEGHFLSTRLATAKVPAKEMGEKALTMLLDIIDGKDVSKNEYVKATPIMEGTCGCELNSGENYAEICFNNYQELLASVDRSLKLSGDFENCETFDDVIRDAYVYSKGFGYEEMYVAMCEADEEDDSAQMGEYTEKMRLAAIISKENGYTRTDEIFDRVDILPEKYRNGFNLISIFPLHFRGHCMGYLAVKLSNPQKLGEGFVLWSNGLSNYLDKINMYERNKQLLRYREESNTDTLTGIYNRRGMDQALSKAVDKAEDDPGLYIISLDMDGLKYINDTYGHSEGDYAIKIIGLFLQAVSGAKVACGRTGGDEFMLSVLGTEGDVKALIGKIRHKIARWNINSGHPYELSASIGYAKYIKEEGLNACIKLADERMYAEKSTKKNARK